MTETKDVPKYKGRGTALNPDYIALWAPYFDEGYASKHIGEIFGVQAATVRKHYPGKGWTNKQASAHGKVMRKLNGN